MGKFLSCSKLTPVFPPKFAFSLSTQPILATRLYVAWSHNNKNLILTGIFQQLSKEQILNKVLSIVKPSNVSESFPAFSLQKSNRLPFQSGRTDRHPAGPRGSHGNTDLPHAPRRCNGPPFADPARRRVRPHVSPAVAEAQQLFPLKANHRFTFDHHFISNEFRITSQTAIKSMNL